jgi:hypothetical protein
MNQMQLLRKYSNFPNISSDKRFKYVLKYDFYADTICQSSVTHPSWIGESDDAVDYFKSVLLENV